MGIYGAKELLKNITSRNIYEHPEAFGANAMPEYVSEKIASYIANGVTGRKHGIKFCGS